MTIPKALGRAIVARRVDLAMTAHHLARMVGISTAHLSDIEHGRTLRLRPGLTWRLGQVLDTDLSAYDPPSAGLARRRVVTDVQCAVLSDLLQRADGETAITALLAEADVAGLGGRFRAALAPLAPWARLDLDAADADYGNGPATDDGRAA